MALSLQEALLLQNLNSGTVVWKTYDGQTSSAHLDNLITNFSKQQSMEELKNELPNVQETPIDGLPPVNQNDVTVVSKLQEFVSNSNNLPIIIGGVLILAGLMLFRK